MLSATASTWAAKVIACTMWDWLMQEVGHVDNSDAVGGAELSGRPS